MNRFQENPDLAEMKNYLISSQHCENVRLLRQVFVQFWIPVNPNDPPTHLKGYGVFGFFALRLGLFGYGVFG